MFKTGIKLLDTLFAPALNIKVGMKVQWTSQAVEQWDEPREVIEIITIWDAHNSSIRYATFAESSTGIPISQLRKA